VVLGIVELVRTFCRTGGGRSKILLVKTHLPTAPTPCKTQKITNPAALQNFTRENPTTKVVIEVVCGGWVQVAMEEGKMADGERNDEWGGRIWRYGPMDDDWG
jgi:hypothetical protein